jgi:trimeric autotransporter adhesin
VSINSVTAASTFTPPPRSATGPTQSKNSTTDSTAPPASAGSSTAPTSLGFNTYGGVEVNLPNGLSVGVFAISPGADPFTQGAGSNGALSQMISSLEQMVASFENSSAPASSTAAQSSAANGSSAAADAADGAAPGSSIEGMTASMPNGISVEVFEAEQGNGTSKSSDGSSDAMASTIEQLVAALEKYPAAAAGAYANSSSAATPAATVNAVA